MFHSSFSRSVAVIALATAGVVGCATAETQKPTAQRPVVLAQAAMPLMTNTFKGAKVNGGNVTLSHKDGKIVLTYSDDFKIPDTPAPHWQVVDSAGNVYLLNRLQIKGDKANKSITLPSYIKDVAKVQIWCAYAEVLLGEASFPSAAM